MPQDATITVYKEDREINISPDAYKEAEGKGWSRTKPAPKAQTPPAQGQPQGGQPKQGVDWMGPLRGAVATTGLADRKTYEGAGQFVGEMALRTVGPMMGMKFKPKEAPSVADVAKNMVDLPAIGKNIKEGKYGEAAGRIGGQALMWANPLSKLFRGAGVATTAIREGKTLKLLTGTLKMSNELDALKVTNTLGKEAGAWAKTTGAEKYMMNARAVSQPLTKALEAREAALSQAMGNKIVNFSNAAGRIQPDLNRAMAYIDKMADTERVSGGSKAQAIIAAKDTVERAQEMLKTHGGVMSWETAREMYKELSSASFALKDSPSYVTATVNKIKDIVGEGLKQTAAAAGHGQEYSSLSRDWHELSNWKRAHAAILGNLTEDQMKVVSSTEPRMWGRLPGGLGVTFGGSTKAQGAMDKALKASGLAYDGLSRRFKVPNPTPGGSSALGNAARGGAIARGVTQQDDNQLVPSH